MQERALHAESHLPAKFSKRPPTTYWRPACSCHRLVSVSLVALWAPWLPSGPSIFPTTTKSTWTNTSSHPCSPSTKFPYNSLLLFVDLVICPSYLLSCHSWYVRIDKMVINGHRLVWIG